MSTYVSIPIIFIHYGDSEYLKYTLRSAKIFNMSSRIILLGDKFNQHYTDIGIEHFFFENYSRSSEIILFKKVYKFIAGKNHGKTEWTQFVFQRWFHIFEFIQSQGIESFWTFDSDTLIFTDLQKFQSELSRYDCTEQCNGICMNGFVSSQKVVKGYLDTINSLFLDTDYLDKQIKEFVDYPDYAFTEMRAYDEYRNRSGLNTIRLQKISNGEIFDECLCQSQGMEFVNGKKKLIFKDGFIYQIEKSSNSLMKVNTINMSWTNIFFIEELFTYVINNHLSRFPKKHFVIQCIVLWKYFIVIIFSRIKAFAVYRR